jgi:hypothetical protein
MKSRFVNANEDVLTDVRPGHKVNKTGNVRVTQLWGDFLQSLLQWKSNNYYILWVCVCVALVVQHAVRMRHIVICYLSLYSVFHINSWTARFFKKSYRKQNVCFDFLYNFCLKHFLILIRNEGDMIKNVVWSSCTVPGILVRY